MFLDPGFVAELLVLAQPVALPDEGGRLAVPPAVCAEPHAIGDTLPAIDAVLAGKPVLAQQIRIVGLEDAAVLVRDIVRVLSVRRRGEHRDRLYDLADRLRGADQRVAHIDRGARQDASGNAAFGLRGYARIGDLVDVVDVRLDRRSEGRDEAEIGVF